MDMECWNGMQESCVGRSSSSDHRKACCNPYKGSIHLTTSVLAHGFESAADHIFFMTERDLTGSKGSVKDAERLPSKRKQAIDPLELTAGDYVVHETTMESVDMLNYLSAQLLELLANI
jgi:transcription-repair coupling factor (superfamily II helicase)